MHYYQFHIGDYRAATSHLTTAEDLAYRRLLDMYYDTERFIPTDVQQVSRRIRCEVSDIETVLHEFFTITPDGWMHERCEKEIKHFQLKIEQASRAGKASAQRRFNARSTDVQPTNNHKPITIKKNTACQKPEDVSDMVWNSFVEHRKSKKAQVSQLVLDSIAKQASEAGWTLEAALTEMVSRGWQGFKAGWVTSKIPTAKQETPEERRKRLAFM
jgi:uncharacterized protein YdaU (DUF1376 family)